MTINDISENIPYDLALTVEENSFTPTNIAFDLAIDNMAFIMNINNQNPYRRETAQYRKDQFDNSNEPGEQSLTGWWLRSQTSFHNGAGINYYEPNGDYANVANRFDDSRGVNVWNIGEVTLLNDVFHNYTGANGIIASTGRAGDNDYIVYGDSTGLLRGIVLDGDDPATTFVNYSLATGHTIGGLTPNPFKSVTTDGTRYFAVCNLAVHVGNLDGTGTDEVIARHGTGGVHCIKYTKGYLMFGEAWYLRFIPLTNPLTTIGHGGSADAFPTGTVAKQHENPSFVWNSIEGGNRVIYAAGYAGSDSEIWAVPFDETTLTPNPALAIEVAQLPFGEIVNAMHYYLGYLAVATNKGIRICQTQQDGSLILGPLLFDSKYEVTGFTAQGNYIYASTSVDEGLLVNACLIRIDLSSPFDDGTFPYAYDLQYQSDENSYGTDVLYANDRLHIITEEGSAAGEIQTENLNQKRSTGWLRTGRIRYGMIEPKYFRYINVNCDTGIGDTVGISVLDQTDKETDLLDITVGLSNQDILLENLYGKQEKIAFKFTLTNNAGDNKSPKLFGYQLKATPATRRQRLIQYPLSCYNVESDRFDQQFGFSGRALQILQQLEGIEETGRFVNIFDFRTNETYTGIIEEVRFINESSPDRDSDGFGGLLLVTVRKM